MDIASTETVIIMVVIGLLFVVYFAFLRVRKKMIISG